MTRRRPGWRPPRVRAFVTLLVAGAVVVTACGSDGRANPISADATTTTASGASGPTEGGGSGIEDADWVQSGHDLANTRTNAAETTLTADDVGDLSEQWSADDLNGVTSTPTVVDGVAYWGDWLGSVHATDTATGQDRWSTDVGASVLSSVPVDGDGVFAGAGATLYRLNRETGEIEWQAVTHRHPFAMISSSPVVADGLVIQGVASGELTVPESDYTFRGSIGAWDAETGEKVWRRFMTPGDDTGGAGVGIWSTPAVDLDRGVLYVGTGNTYEPPTAPLGDSIAAMDLRTGDIEWSTQFTNPDVFAAGGGGGTDSDVGAAPNLFTVDGQDLVGAGDKAGTYYALDRDTGDEVWSASLTQGSILGGAIGSGAYVDDTLVVTSNVGNPDDNLPTAAAEVDALDPATGDILWEVPLDTNVYAPVSAVPGVAFVGTTAGTLLALDTRTGHTLWQTTADNQSGSGPSIVDGQVLWGYGFALFGGPGKGGLIAYGLDDAGGGA